MIRWGVIGIAVERVKGGVVPAARQFKHFLTNAYHQNESLLLQFVMSEFLLGYREIQWMHDLFQNLQTVVFNNYPQQLSLENFNTFITSLERLSGASRDTMCLFSWGQEGGLLHKLNTYATMIFKHCSSENKLKTSLYHQVNQSLLASLQLHDLAFAVRELPSSDWKFFFEKMIPLEKKVAANFDKFAKLLPQYISQFSEDENVIFFILRHHKEFDQLFHRGYVKMLFEKDISYNLKNLENNLITKYRERGFLQLLPIIMHQFEELRNS